MIADDTLGQRLGCAAKIIGQPLPTSDNRRPQNNPSLTQSILYAHDVFDYLETANIRLFRLPSNFCPYATHPDYPDFAWQQQFTSADGALTGLGEHAQRLGLRLSFHPSQYILLNSPRPEVVAGSIAELDWQCRLLDALGQDDASKVFLHVGGVYGDRPAAAERLIEQVQLLPDHIRRRFALENDDVSWPAADVLDLCQQLQLPMIFDIHHHLANNHGEPWQEMLAAALATWPDDQRPKIHLSSPKDPTAAPGSRGYRSHADYIDSSGQQWLLAAQQLVDQQHLPLFDCMLEAKAKDLAVLQLRTDIKSASAR